MTSPEPEAFPGLTVDALLYLSHELLGHVRADGRLITANPSWQRGGRAPARLHDLLTPDSHPALERALATAVAEGRADARVDDACTGAHLELRLARTPGDDSLVATASPVEPPPFCAHMAIRRAAVGLMIVDEDGRFHYVNDAYCRTYGHSREDLLGRPFTDLIREENRSSALAFHRQVFAQPERDHQRELEVVHRDGSPMQIRTSSRCIHLYGDEQLRLGTIVDVTDIRQQERRLAETEAEFREIFNNTSEGIYRSTPDGRLIRANPSLVQLHGFASEQELLDAVTDVARDWYVDPQARDRLTELLARDDRVTDFEAEIHQLGTGSGRIWVSESARAVRNEEGEILFFEGSIRDISAEHRSRLLSAHRSHVLEMIARGEALTEILYELAGAIEQLHPRLTIAVLTLREGRLEVVAAPGLANSCIAALHERAPSEVGDILVRGMRKAGSAGGERLDQLADEDESVLATAAREAGYGSILIDSIRDQQDSVLGMMMAFAQYATDTSGDQERELLTEMSRMAAVAMEQARLTEELVYQAQYDTLTGLPNRSLLNDRLQQAMHDAQRGGYPVGLMLLDLDEFKLINDTLGHDAGDHLLQAVAERLTACMRGSDTVARLGGDEFVVITPLHDGAEASEIADRVLAALQGQVMIEDRAVTARPSIGISIFPDDGATPESLLQAADTAMYAAKQSGKNRYHYFAASMNRIVSERLLIESGLRKALDNDELVLHYQPQIRLRDHGLVGAEALLRWQHPIHGLLWPADFLPIAERSSLITEVDHHVLAMAARQVALSGKAGHSVVISVNLSARDLSADDYGARVSGILEQASADPAGLELEITETMLMEDFDHAVDQLRDLKERAPGLRIAIDDFGMGHSSLNYLRRIPVDTLKIDRSFIADMECEPASRTARAIAQTIVDLGRNLGLHIIAEGVETEAQARALQAMGCNDAQGYWFDHPMPWEELERRYLSGPAAE